MLYWSLKLTLRGLRLDDKLYCRFMPDGIKVLK